MGIVFINSTVVVGGNKVGDEGLLTSTLSMWVSPEPAEHARKKARKKLREFLITPTVLERRSSLSEQEGFLN
ncbi:MAG: hypothetical protein QXP80_03950 [Zestosphaera sp.]